MLVQSSRQWNRLLPFLSWWPRVTGQTLKADVVAGITGALVALPQGVAFAVVAGMPIQYGLYAGMIPAVVAALFGSSWHLVSGPTTAASIVLFSSLSLFATPGSEEYVRLALTLTFMVGAIQLALGLARLGTLVNFVSHAVVVGFTAGAALLIMASQARHFFGLALPAGGHFHETIWAILIRLGDIDPAVTAVGVATVLAGILGRRFFNRVPYMIPAMLVGGLMAYWLGHWSGIEGVDIPMAGEIPPALPPLSFPDFSVDTIRQLAPAALAMTLFALTEAVSIGRSLAVRSGQHLNGNQEFIGQGLSNIVGSFFSAYVATGSFNRSAVNYEAGARTPLAAVFAGLVLMLIIVPAAPLGAYLPNAAMAGVLFLVAVGLIDTHHILTIVRTSRSDAAVLITTFVCTLVFELEFAILAGVILSLVMYLARTSRPRVTHRVPNPADPRRTFVTDPALPECPQLKLVRIEGSLFFGAVHHVRESLRLFRQKSPEQTHLAITARGINFIDAAGADLIAEETRERRAMGGDLYLVRPKQGVLNPLRSGGYMAFIGEHNVFASKQEAIAQIVPRLDPERCRRCDKRIFLECNSLT